LRQNDTLFCLDGKLDESLINIVIMRKLNSQTKDAVGAGVPCFFSIAELMMRTGLSRSSINRQIKAGNIPIVRIGSRILIPYSYLETLQIAAEAAVTVKKEKNEELQQ